MNENRFDPVTHFFPFIVKPGRYSGSEPGAVIPDADAGVRLLLVHPGEYASAIADLDYQRLYFILNSIPGVSAERAVCFDSDARQRLADLGKPPFSLETRRPWTDFSHLVFYVADPLEAVRIPQILNDFRPWAATCPPVVIVSGGRVIPHFLAGISALCIGDVSFAGLVRKMGEAMGFEPADAVERFFAAGESSQIVALTGTPGDELKIPLYAGPTVSPVKAPAREPMSVARDVLLGLDKTGLESIRFLAPVPRSYPGLPEVFSHLSLRAKLAHHQVRVPPITPQEYLDSWTDVRPHFLKSELPLIFPGGERIADVPSHPLAEAGQQALALGWRVLILAYHFDHWNTYREGLSSLIALADFLTQRCKSYSDRRIIRIQWLPASGNDWAGPFECDQRMRSVLSSIHRGALKRLPGVPIDDYFDPSTELLRQLLLRAGPDFVPVLEELPLQSLDEWTTTEPDLFTTILDAAEIHGIPLPEFGWPVDLSLSSFLQSDTFAAEVFPDYSREPRDLPVLTQVFGRRRRKAAFTRRLAVLPKRRLRVQYAKDANLRVFSHLDIVRMVERAIRRSRVPVEYSAGYHPRPKISFGPPLPWGAISRAEYFDLVLDADYEPGHATALEAQFPEGLQILQTLALPAKAVSLFERINLIRYRVELPPGDADWTQRIQEFINGKSAWFERTTDSVSRRIDIRPYVEDLRIDRNGDTVYLEMDLSLTNQGTARPAEVVLYLGAGEKIDPRSLLIERLEVFIQEGSRRTSPMECV